MPIESIKLWLNFFHPLLMWGLLAIALYTGYLGWQWRQTRLAEGDAKKELVKGKFKIRHHQLSAILLSLMVAGTVGGMAVTYINNGKLFVGPHLIVGLIMTVLIASSAALVPFMQKGNDVARYSHITLNAALVGLFGWQTITGTQIIQKILENF